MLRKIFIILVINVLEVMITLMLVVTVDTLLVLLLSMIYIEVATGTSSFQLGNAKILVPTVDTCIQHNWLQIDSDNH